MISEDSGRHGVKPVVRMLPYGAAEAEHIARHVRVRLDSGVSWSDIAVLYQTAWHGASIKRALVTAGVPVHQVRTRADNEEFVARRAFVVALDDPRRARRTRSARRSSTSP